ncbi:MAG: protein jag [Clostridia bacterium]|jgi:spoIIIJ-associated protein|nr:protein jag [Clostridia bacterium]MCI2015064.1 protein jag [Clostridia bacterium]
MQEITVSAKTEEKAVEEAVVKLNVASADELEIEVIEKGSKGFLGFGGKDAVIKAKIKFDPEKTAKKFLREMFAAMGIVVEIDTELKEKQLLINLKGSDMGILIGKRGQTLDSIQYLVNLVVNKGNAPYLSITLDTENYRQRRKETLESLAYNLAKKVKQTGRKVVLEPMNPYERRIIHSSLQNNRYVTTYSEGEEPFRNVVIALKDKDREK